MGLAQMKCARKRTAELKLEIYSMLGGKCLKCGYIGPALQIDHVNGNGRKENSHMNVYYYYLLVKKSILAGEKKYQLLCANCNWEKRLQNKEAKVLPWV